jgi:hypothetical protein
MDCPVSNVEKSKNRANFLWRILLSPTGGSYEALRRPHRSFCLKRRTAFRPFLACFLSAMNADAGDHQRNFGTRPLLHMSVKSLNLKD